jgi:hypothetical protein
MAFLKAANASFNLSFSLKTSPKLLQATGKEGSIQKLNKNLIFWGIFF